jgi:hypothetical protein
MEGREMSADRTPSLTTGQREHWLAALESHGVQFLVVNKHRDRALLDLVQSQPGWGIDFEDGEVALYKRVRVSRAA